MNKNDVIRELNSIDLSLDSIKDSLNKRIDIMNTWYESEKVKPSFMRQLVNFRAKLADLAIEAEELM